MHSKVKLISLKCGYEAAQYESLMVVIFGQNRLFLN